jgi:4-hydroxybutyrate dehydrogenase
MMNAVLDLPRTVFAPGASARLPEELEALGVRRPLVISDAGLRSLGLLQQVLARLPGDTPVFDQVTPNPVFADVDAGCARYLESRCDGVVAVGGGSVLDVAKLVALLATHAGTVRDYVGRREPFTRPAAPLVAIPTTAGTGSEASPDAGIHPDANTASTGVNSRWAVPRVALLDPLLTVGLPARLTAATGIDALSHCIEGYLSNVDSPVAEAMALDGLRRALSHVEQASRHGDDLAARSEMLLAGYLGGVAIGMGLGPAHAIAISCGDQGLHHGVLSGIGVVATLDDVLARMPERHATLASLFKVAGDQSLSAAVAALMQRLGLPATLGAAGYRPGDPMRLAEMAHSSVFNLSARWHPAASDYRRWIADSVADRLPDR